MGAQLRCAPETKRPAKGRREARPPLPLDDRVRARLAAKFPDLRPDVLDVLATLHEFTTDAELLRVVPVTTRTLRTWRSTGRLTGLQTSAGGMVLYTRESVARLLLTMPMARGA